MLVPLVVNAQRPKRHALLTHMAPVAQSAWVAQKVGHDIVTASGTTLLGADDKAGVAILMTAARHLLADPSLSRPTLRLAFTPDEEIGRGVDKRLPADLGALPVEDPGSRRLASKAS